MDRDDFYRQILAAAAEGSVVLTANKRLARHLRSLFDARMRTEGRAAWKTPQMQSAEAWMHQSLAALGQEARLLDGFASLRLWEHVVETDTAGSGLGLLQVPATARRAQEAHQLLSEYQVEMTTEPLTEDHSAFLRWQRAYLDACGAGGWLDPAQLTQVLCEAISQRELALPPAVLLVGFDELSPRLLRLQQALSAAGCTVEVLPPPSEPCGELRRLVCADIEDEVRQAARWARNLLEKGAESIGIIVPDLQSYRPFVERIFRAEIDPGALASMDDESAGFSLSLGSSLVEQGLIVAAFEILGAGFSTPLDTLSYLLRSPYLGGSQREAYGRARLDRALRSSKALQVSLRRLKELCAEQSGELPVLKGICEALEKGLSDSRKATTGQWAGRFSQVLQAAGWPGERPLGSIEYQVHKAWREKLLPAMVSLEAVSPAMDRGAALALLRRLASEIDFQPETPSGPLQVVGILEAAGLHFDHLWVMGLSAEALPAAARPNPFIPVSLQVAQGMPHSSARRELDFARKLVRRLLAGAPQVVLSHPSREGECDLRPSPLIAAVETGEVELAATHTPEEVLRRQAPPLEALVDEQGPPLGLEERASGGTSILKDQALCPFRAFAHHRLAARALDQAEIGLDAGTRGTLLHSVLERFWALTRSHGNLCALAEAELEERIARCVEGALDDVFGAERADSSKALLEIEARRVSELAREWLVEVERGRPPFEVAELEAEHTETFGGLTIGTKVDRIDQLEDGSRAILDYKTGRIDLGDLLGERLLEPQLPIYGSGSASDGVAAVAVAALRKGECAIKGVARDGHLLPRVEAFAGSKLAEKHGIEDWDELLRRWRTQLEGLGEEFNRGMAAVDPVDLKKACQYCDLAGFCRIDEIQLRQEDSE